MPYDAERVLARWREVERELAAADPGSPEAERLREEAAGLRDEYQQLMADVEGHAQQVRDLETKP
jgi:hypothetical protein